MPRIPPSAIRHAHRISPYAAQLLPECRDLQSALNEARWICEHVQQERQASVPFARSPNHARLVKHEIESLCRRRARGEPLQYLLGTQPFGNLEMKCRPGVLIPRSEPEAYTTYLANLVLQNPFLLLGGGKEGAPRPIPSSLRILDLCTGTGCIALLFYSILHRNIRNLSVHGVDISPHAVKLAEENVQHNIQRHTISPPTPWSTLAFSQGDIFSDALLESLSPFDILVCNPPYISPWGFAHQTARSVRHYEPKLAQVPMVKYPGDHQPEDAFYARLLDMGANKLRPRIMLFEVGGLEQAVRVAKLAHRHVGLCQMAHQGSGSSSNNRHISIEIWRDWPDAMPAEDEQTMVKLGHHGEEVCIRGSGHGRSVFIQCQ